MLRLVGSGPGAGNDKAVEYRDGVAIRHPGNMVGRRTLHWFAAVQTRLKNIPRQLFGISDKLIEKRMDYKCGFSDVPLRGRVRVDVPQHELAQVVENVQECRTGADCASISHRVPPGLPLSLGHSPVEVHDVAHHRVNHLGGALAKGSGEP